MYRGAGQAIVHGVAKSRAQLSDWAYVHACNHFLYTVTECLACQFHNNKLWESKASQENQEGFAGEVSKAQVRDQPQPGPRGCASHVFKTWTQLAKTREINRIGSHHHINKSGLSFSNPDSSVGKKSSCNAGDPGSIPGSRSFPAEEIRYPLKYFSASLVTQTVVKNSPVMEETRIRSLGWEDLLEEGMANHSSILAWRIPIDRGAWWVKPMCHNYWVCALEPTLSNKRTYHNEQPPLAPSREKRKTQQSQ